jgi:hypothetical protein
MTNGFQRLMRDNVRLAKLMWSNQLGAFQIHTLRSLTKDYRFVIALGDLLFLDGRWYVTHAGLLRVALRRRCIGIRTILLQRQSNAIAGRWVFKAVVYKSDGSGGFAGYGDADPSNVSVLVQGAEMRIAETRAVNRALRKAYGIGLCSVEELGSVSGPRPSAPTLAPAPATERSNGQRASKSHGQPRLRDQLCLLIRQHNLDPNLVKAYAADFCGTATISGATRDLVESFISHLAASAKENRDDLICKLNSYAQPREVKL